VVAWLGGGGTFIQSKASNEVDAGRNWAAPASVRHDDDEPLTPISSCYCMTVLEPLGLVAEISVKVNRRDRWSVVREIGCPSGGRAVYSYSMILLGDPGACLRLNHHSSLTRVRATCSPVSGGKTIRLCSCWPSGGPPTPLRSSVTAERFGPRSDFDSRSDDGGFVLVGTLSRDLLASNNQSL
jgi:hypothetical protein